MTGYAVVDTETTGLFPGASHRIIEIAVVNVAADGQIEDSWSTLLNPERDLGRQDIHGIRVADVLDAPTFAEIAGEVADRLAGRAFVAHNVGFDQRFVQAEFTRSGWTVPLADDSCLCTMHWTTRLFPHAPRTLGGCCAHLGITLENAHSALADATAAAELLRACLHAAQSSPWTIAPGPPWSTVLDHVGTKPWPSIARSGIAGRPRAATPRPPEPFLARLAESLPRTAETWEQEQYLALLDRALLDRVLSTREQSTLAAVASDLSIDRDTARALHRRYLEQLARAAWADGILTDAEHADLLAVAELLSLTAAEVTLALDLAQQAQSSDDAAAPAPTRFALAPGDLVVFTGDMRVAREEWMVRAVRAGLTPHPAVTKKVALVVAADPDSLSGKAKKAAAYGIPIVTEESFAQMLAALHPAR